MIALSWALLLLAVSRYGLGLSPDSANYLSAAESLRASGTLLEVSGAPLTVFPPLLPLAIAALSLSGVSGVVAGMLLNLICFAVVLWVTVSLTAEATGSDRAGLAAGAFVAVSAPMLDGFSWLLSETLFVALLAGFTWLVWQQGVEIGTGKAAALGLVAALVPLARYVGVVLPAAVILTLLLLSRAPVAARLRTAVVFGAVSALPLTGYLIRNVLIVGQSTGERVAATVSPISVLRGFVLSAVDWVIPFQWLMQLQRFSDEPWALALFFLAGLAAAVLLTLPLVTWWRDAERQRRVPVFFLGAWVVGYSVFLCGSAMLVAFNPIAPRFLLPILFPSVILAAISLATLSRGRLRVGAGRAVLVVTLVVIAVLQVGRALDIVVAKRTDGAGGFASRMWQESPFVAFVVDQPPAADTATNAPDVLYLFVGRRYPWSPRHQESPVESRAAGVEALAWFDLVTWRPYLVNEADVVRRQGLQLVHPFADGRLYRRPTGER